jgi:hypothetical protein
MEAVLVVTEMDDSVVSEVVVLREGIRLPTLQFQRVNRALERSRYHRLPRHRAMSGATTDTQLGARHRLGIGSAAERDGPSTSLYLVAGILKSHRIRMLLLGVGLMPMIMIKMACISMMGPILAVLARVVGRVEEPIVEEHVSGEAIWERVRFPLLVIL